MKTFVLLIAIVTNTGEVKLENSVVDECPDDNGILVAGLETQRIHGEIVSWGAACLQFSLKYPNA